jgi:hypothetical protein
MVSILSVSPYTSFFGFIVGLPTLAATYYQSWKSRRESERARQGLIFSGNCLEFILEDGTSINLVPLETLHSLPKPGDIVLLPGSNDPVSGGVEHGAYSVRRIEHIYTRVEDRKAARGQARLIKAVAHVDMVSGPILNEVVSLSSI